MLEISASSEPRSTPWHPTLTQSVSINAGTPRLLSLEAEYQAARPSLLVTLAKTTRKTTIL